MPEDGSQDKCSWSTILTRLQVAVELPKADAICCLLPVVQLLEEALRPLPQQADAQAIAMASSCHKHTGPF